MINPTLKLNHIYIISQKIGGNIKKIEKKILKIRIV